MSGLFYFSSVIGAISLLGPTCSQALMYECLNASGTMNYTDSPVQLGQCKAISADNSSSHATTSEQINVGIPGMVFPASVLATELGLEKVTATAFQAVSIQRSGNLLVVHARLNESRDARLILDTGASHTILSHEIARALAVLPPANITAVTLKTAGGPVQAEMIRLDSIRVGQAEARNVPVAVHDLPDAPPGIDGLLGLTFLHQFLVTLDIQKGELRLEKRN